MDLLHLGLLGGSVFLSALVVKAYIALGQIKTNVENEKKKHFKTLKDLTSDHAKAVAKIAELEKKIAEHEKKPTEELMDFMTDIRTYGYSYVRVCPDNVFQAGRSR